MAATVKNMEEKEQIIREFIPLVKYIASRVFLGKSKYVEYDDLVGYGMIGLIDAINKFDDSKGMKFSTYASIRIKGSIIDEIRRISPISKTAMDKLNLYNDTIENLQKTNLREPTVDEIAEAMDIDVSEIVKIEGYINYISTVSLEDMIFAGEDDVPLKGIIEDKNSLRPEEILEEKEKISMLAAAIEELNEKDKRVLTLYYYESLTLKQIGKIFNVSESRVCQLHSRAIIHLRKIMSKLKYK
ncbi:RNA polymerase, sigma 28 subunit, SigD/FliA/WhiG [Hathewaya proteolytica DSM 3090]|uniref:RNA polymerase, sigma 28 subunit, SigD/FliA/WhiG n=1 Tax=Hathewaya proteolytica DSM 3090 TaxID=1121331 RepID=A0A1M6L9A7_9CLOT|nr:FliA/WhiG family RNA polymerase sigma factor [Hathewaya proteolytica]SHJ67689.1 RNA polymerase, sigma 28 subunit, SigD/FliA/WhiG [Hathewaya proteolytica DSM 3090]